MGISTFPVLAEERRMIDRPIPASGERLPVIGLGTYSVFDVPGTAEEIAKRKEIVDLLLGEGGSVIDTSPMYNRSEQVIGEIIRSGTPRQSTFLATKVWIDGREAGAAQMTRSAELMNTDVIDLMQVHNLRDTDAHMKTIREWQNEGRIRYNGLTHYRASAHEAMEGAMKQYRPHRRGLGDRRARQPALPGRCTVSRGTRSRPAGLGPGVCIELGSVFPQVHHQPSGSHLRDSGDQ
jgi:hypothetical protein